MIKIVYFASIREQLGLANESIELPVLVSTIADLSAWLQRERGEKWEKALSNPSTLIALNQEMVSGQEALKAGDEVAFFPPVTGG
ncbi:MAG: molybdopterin synthase sulfur carrier subunit [Oceanospirillaceae bacterium]|jgi:molybdopterin synthase sulfur carrier subunit